MILTVYHIPQQVSNVILMFLQDSCHEICHLLGGTRWLHEARSVEKDAVVVSRLRSCGAVLLGKANMHELGMGTSGNNSNYG